MEQPSFSNAESVRLGRWFAGPSIWNFARHHKVATSTFHLHPQACRRNGTIGETHWILDLVEEQEAAKTITTF